MINVPRKVFKHKIKAEGGNCTYNGEVFLLQDRVVPLMNILKPWTVSNWVSFFSRSGLEKRKSKCLGALLHFHGVYKLLFW